MSRRRITLTIALLTLWLLASALYALSWTNPQCLAAWYHDDSYMLATSKGDLWCLREHDESGTAPYPEWWTIRWFSALGPIDTVPADFLFMDVPDALSHKRQWLNHDPEPSIMTAKLQLLGLLLARSDPPLFAAPASPASPPVSTDYFRLAIIPLWALWLPLTAFTALVSRKTRTILRRRKRGQCPACGYDLRATPDQCPECGRPVPKPKPMPHSLSDLVLATCDWARHHPLRVGTILTTGLAALLLLCLASCPRIIYIHIVDAPTTRPAPLGKPVHVAFENARLEQVLSSWGQESGVPIIVDWQSLAQDGIDRNTPITEHLSGTVPLDTALRSLLRLPPVSSADCYTDADGVIHVGSQLGSLANITRTYDVRDLMEHLPPAPLAPRRDSWPGGQAIRSLILTSIAPESWTDNGGTSASLQQVNGLLTITARPETHAKIAAFLTHLRHQAGLHPPTQP